MPRGVLLCKCAGLGGRPGPFWSGPFPRRDHQRWSHWSAARTLGGLDPLSRTRVSSAAVGNRLGHHTPAYAKRPRRLGGRTPQLRTTAHHQQDWLDERERPYKAEVGGSKPPAPTRTVLVSRSEERRVGKECRSRW